MTHNPRLHRTLNQRGCACWFRASGEEDRYAAQKGFKRTLCFSEKCAG